MNLETIKTQVKVIRTASEAFLTDIAQLYRREGESVINGESVVDWSEPIEIQCRLISRTGDATTNIAAQERLPSQLQFSSNYRMHVAYATEVAVGDRIEFTDVESDQVRTFDVLYCPPRHHLMAAKILELREAR